MNKTKETASNLLSGLTNLYLLAMTAVLTLAFDSTGYLHIVEVKKTVFAVLTGSYLVLSGLCWVRGRSAERKARGHERKLIARESYAICAFIVYLLLTMVSAFCAADRSLAVWGAGRGMGASYIVMAGLAAIAVCLSFQGCRLLVPCAALVLLVQDMLALLQFTGANPLGLFPPGLSYLDAGVRYSGSYLGTVGNADLFAAVLSLGCGVMLASALWDGGCLGRGDARIDRVFYGLVYLLTACVIFRSDVAAGMAAVLGGTVILLIFYALSLIADKEILFGRRLPKNFFALALAVLLVMALAVVFALYLLPFEAGALGEAHQLLHGNVSDSFGSGRIGIWRQCLAVVQDHPLLGVGPECLSKAGLKGFSRLDATYGLIERSIDAAHNEYLNAAVCQGLPALCALLTAALLVLKNAFLGAKAEKLRKKEAGLAAGSAVRLIAASGLLFYMIQAFFGIATCYTTPLAFLAAAIAGKKAE